MLLAADVHNDFEIHEVLQSPLQDLRLFGHL